MNINLPGESQLPPGPDSQTRQAPVPIVKTNGGWYFDTDAGKDELLSRRVGKNDLSTLPVLRAYVDAQRDYASRDHDGDGVLEYSQRLVNSPGKQDGLYWLSDLDGEESPLGPLVAFAQFEGYSPELRDEKNEVERGPFHGYYSEFSPGRESTRSAENTTM